ncbi:MAG: hypothetical protein ABSE86_27535 [Bryobacteraceae bacterium]|jgi:hypothetical protein
MTPTDELRQLWQSDISEAINQRELLSELQRRSRSFDRRNRRRDLVDIVAMLIIIVVYFWFALHAGNTLERVADVWLVVSAGWFIFYVRRYARISRKPVPEQTLGAYRQALVERYDSQIRLAKSVKYFFVLPMWLGQMLFNLAYWMNGGKNFKFVMVTIVVTAGNVLVWWLNEGPGIRYLKRKRRELAVLVGEEGVAK